MRGISYFLQIGKTFINRYVMRQAELAFCGKPHTLLKRRKLGQMGNRERLKPKRVDVGRIQTK